MLTDLRRVLFALLPFSILWIAHPLYAHSSQTPTQQIDQTQTEPPDSLPSQTTPLDPITPNDHTTIPSLAASPAVTVPMIYVVKRGDTLSAIAIRYGITLNALIAANPMKDPNRLFIGQRLVIPGRWMEYDPNQVQPQPTAPPRPQGSLTDRLTEAARNAPPSSPFYRTTWLTYYGRPSVPVMGILGEYGIDQLTALLKQKVLSYDAVNGSAFSVTPAFHLVYGMAVKAPMDDKSHLIYLSDEVVMRYINRAQQEGFAVILDVQIGTLSPADALAKAFPYLKYKNVHLALDPEFAMVHPKQIVPGNPIGFIYAAQINAAQAAMQKYLVENQLPGQRVLLIHQFLETMIVDKAKISAGYDRVLVTLSVDGWGPPAGKLSKYNVFTDASTRFSSFKLFYRWDSPLLNESQALGIEAIYGGTFIGVTPNMIIYQ